MAEAAEFIEPEKEWTEGPADMIEGLNSMVKTINRLSDAVNEMRRDEKTRVNVVVWYPTELRWILIGVKATMGGEAESVPDVNCVCDCTSGAAEAFGDA